MGASLAGIASLRPAAPSSGAVLAWQTVADFDLSLEADQSTSGGKLTLTNRITGAPVELDSANGCAVAGGALVLTTSAGAQLAVTSASTDTAPRLDAPILTLWPEFGGEALAFGAACDTAPSMTETSEAWGVMVNGPVRMGGGATGWGFTAESRHNGTNVVRNSRWQSSNTGTANLSTASYAAKVCGLKTGGLSPFAVFSTSAAELLTLDTVTPLGHVGVYAGASGGSPIGGTPTNFRLGVFATAGATAGPNPAITRIVLRALKVAT